MILPLLLVSVTLPVVVAFTGPAPVMLPAIDRPPVMAMSPPVVVALAITRPFSSVTVSVAFASLTFAASVLIFVPTAIEFCAEIVSTLPTT